MFTPGQFVICVGELRSTRYKEMLPKCGVVYTVRGFDSHSVEYILLEELLNPLHMYAAGLIECSFDVRVFRPLKDTALEVFRGLLAPTPEQAREIIFSDAEHEMQELLEGRP